MNCTVTNCQEEATPGLAICSKHEDLQVLIDFLTERKQPVTLESLKAALAAGMANGGAWSITNADIEAEMAGQTRRQEVTQ